MTFQERDGGHDEYATPPKLWRPLAEAVDGFDVDPASGAEPTPIASTRFTEEDNGLEQAWHGDVWLNPPFGDQPGTKEGSRERWLKKARREASRDDVRCVSVLLPVDTSTHWWHRHVAVAPVVCFLGPGRLEFDNALAKDACGTSIATMIAVYGEPPENLVDALEERGDVYRRSDRVESVRQVSL